MVHENSLISYIEEKQEGKIGKRQAEVFNYLKNVKSATAREIMIGLKYTEMNQVRPRLTELKEYNLIQEINKVKDKVTNKTVSLFSINKNKI